MIEPKTQLVDARNWGLLKAPLLLEIQSVTKCGFDLETEDSRRHDGLNRFMGVKNGKKAGNKSLVFDIRRTTITGFSWYCAGSDTAYYLNLNHADTENRIPWESARVIVDAIIEHTIPVIHNAPFERTMMRMCYSVDLGDRVIDSMQLAVTAFNDDTYDFEDFKCRDLGGMKVLIPAIRRAFKDYQPRAKLNSEQEEILFKVIAKESTAHHSYNGWVKEIAYRFGLKNLGKHFLKYEQMTFAEVLGDKAHMGELTGEEVVAYGADDAWVCLELVSKLMEYINRRSPAVIPTFIAQENPMSRVYSDVWCEGLRVDIEAVKRAQQMEREKTAAILRIMKKGVKALLPFPEEPHPKLKKYDKWFYQEKMVDDELVIKENYKRYRQKIVDWANLPDCDDPFDQLYQVRSAISNAWAEDQELKASTGVNLNHYMPVRTLLYDLCHFSYIQADGKTQSNGEAQKTMRERWIKKHGEVKGDAALLVLDCLLHLGKAEQIMKLFVTNYLQLTDPETGKMYPVLNSLLNTRRMALSFPNVSQLPKEGYVRTFFLPDNDDHLIISADWSAIELLIIGELSGDESFYEAYGQLPHTDLHAKAAAGCLGYSIEHFKQLDDYKKLRKEVGKGANFNYWYSGALGTVGERLGWSSKVMWDKVDGYRNTFYKGEMWRTGTIKQVRASGEVELPDHHKRYRFEATSQWRQLMLQKFYVHGTEVGVFGEVAVKKIQTRAGNQAVNADVQGTCATLAKRSIINMNNEIVTCDYDARFAFPVHDELVFSVHKDNVLAFSKTLKRVMCDFPDLFKRLKLDATVAIGRNFAPYDKDKNPFGQVELDELNMEIEGLEYGSKLDDTGINKVIDYMVKDR